MIANFFNVFRRRSADTGSNLGKLRAERAKLDEAYQLFYRVMRLRNECGERTGVTPTRLFVGRAEWQQLQPIFTDSGVTMIRRTDGLVSCDVVLYGLHVVQTLEPSLLVVA